MAQNTAIKQLKALALEKSRERYPRLPEEARSCKPYSDKTANSLTRCVIDFLRYSGHQAERISATGRMIDGTKIVTDCLGNKRRIGSQRWIYGSMQPGSADISAIVNGQSWKIEIKMRDKMSEKQMRYAEQVRKAGGVYIVVHSLAEFLDYYNALTHKQ